MVCLRRCTWIPLGYRSRKAWKVSRYPQQRTELELLNACGLLLPWMKETPAPSSDQGWSVRLGVDSVQPHFPYFGKDMSSDIATASARGRLLQFVWQMTVMNRGETSLPMVLPCQAIDWKFQNMDEPARAIKSDCLESRIIGRLWSKLSAHENSDCERVCLHRDLRFL